LACHLWLNKDDKARVGCWLKLMNLTSYASRLGTPDLFESFIRQHQLTAGLVSPSNKTCLFLFRVLT